MFKIGIMGERDSVLGFKAVGLSVFPVEQMEEAEKTIDRLAKDDFAVIYITEQLAQNLKEVIEKYKDSSLPAIIPIPGNSGSKGIGMQVLKDAVERAVGANILEAF